MKLQKSCNDFGRQKALESKTHPNANKPSNSQINFQTFRSMVTFMRLGFLRKMTVNHPHRQMCETRLKFLHRKLKVDTALLNEYHSIIQEQERKISRHTPPVWSLLSKLLNKVLRIQFPEDILNAYVCQGAVTTARMPTSQSYRLHHCRWASK